MLWLLPISIATAGMDWSVSQIALKPLIPFCNYFTLHLCNQTINNKRHTIMNLFLISRVSDNLPNYKLIYQSKQNLNLKDKDVQKWSNFLFWLSRIRKSPLPKHLVSCSNYLRFSQLSIRIWESIISYKRKTTRLGKQRLLKFQYQFAQASVSNQPQ